jgi:nitroimidazol reductase NimA-like FMN-containing flavoprotein (pyridoxamine 5'-phosphate oxidase superfamily)
MDEPVVGRPWMPGYGMRGPSEGTGLLPWSWAEDRLAASHDYWAASVWPDGRPHVMPVWGIWQNSALWFSSGGRSRKARNLKANAYCTLTTDNAREPVVLQGTAELITDLDRLRQFLDATNRKYSTEYTMELMDPEKNACFRVRPAWVFGLATDDFTGSPTRWVFG